MMAQTAQYDSAVIVTSAGEEQRDREYPDALIAILSRGFHTAVCAAVRKCSASAECLSSIFGISAECIFLVPSALSRKRPENKTKKQTPESVNK